MNILCGCMYDCSKIILCNIGPDAKQPKMAWCDVPSVKEECSGPKMPILEKSRDEPKVSGT